MIAMRDYIPLRYLADWRSVVTVAATILVISVQWSGVFRHPLLWCTSVLLIYACFLINHNHQHIPVFTRPWLNHVFDLMLTMATGLRASLLIPLHNRNHHDARNGPGDYMTTAILRWKNPALRLLLYPFAAAFAYAPQKVALIRAIAHDEPWLQRRLLAQRVVLWLMLGIMLVLRPWDTVIFLLLPWFLCHYWVINANLIQHDGCDSASSDRHSRDITGGLVNWYAFNGGFHTVHHEQPHLHWSELPLAHAARASSLTPQLNETWFLLVLWRLAIGRHKRSEHSS